MTRALESRLMVVADVSFSLVWSSKSAYRRVKEVKRLFILCMLSAPVLLSMILQAGCQPPTETLPFPASEAVVHHRDAGIHFTREAGTMEALRVTI